MVTVKKERKKERKKHYKLDKTYKFAC